MQSVGSSISYQSRRKDNKRAISRLTYSKGNFSFKISWQKGLPSPIQSSFFLISWSYKNLGRRLWGSFNLVVHMFESYLKFIIQEDDCGFFQWHDLKDYLHSKKNLRWLMNDMTNLNEQVKLLKEKFELSKMKVATLE